MDPGSDADAPASPIDPQEDAALYPYDGKFLSAEDRRNILSLPEIERESILAERAAEVLKRQQDLQLQKAFATSQAQASKNQKRKAAAADLDDGVRKSSRAKTEKTGRSALDDYKKAREAKGAERTSRLDAGGRSGKRSQSASASDRDADGESEVEWAEPASKSRRDEPAAELKDVDRCRIGRSAFAKIHFYPHFEETMKGCFARVSIGMNRETGQNMYRMTQIKGESQRALPDFTVRHADFFDAQVSPQANLTRWNFPTGRPTRPIPTLSFLTGWLRSHGRSLPALTPPSPMPSSNTTRLRLRKNGSASQSASGSIRN